MFIRILIAVIIALCITALLIVLSKRAKQSRDRILILKNLYDNFSRKSTAQIVSFKSHASDSRNHDKSSIEIKMVYRGIAFRYIIKTDNKKALKYESKTYIPVLYIPVCLDYYYNLISADKAYKLLQVKYDIQNQDMYPMIIFEEDKF